MQRERAPRSIWKRPRKDWIQWLSGGPRSKGNPPAH